MSSLVDNEERVLISTMRESQSEIVERLLDDYTVKSPSKVFSVIGVDIVKSGGRQALTIVCSESRYLMCVNLPDTSAVTTAKWLRIALRQIGMLNAVTMIVTDRCGRLTVAHIEELKRSFGVISPDHRYLERGKPETEWWSVVESLSIERISEKDDWEERISCLAFQLNSRRGGDGSLPFSLFQCAEPIHLREPLSETLLSLDKGDELSGDGLGSQAKRRRNA